MAAGLVIGLCVSGWATSAVWAGGSDIVVYDGAGGVAQADHAIRDARIDMAAAQDLYNEVCSVCHGAIGGLGRTYPRWLGDTHAVYTMTEDQLILFLRQTMPFDRPGSLTDDEYRTLAIYLRQVTIGP